MISFCCQPISNPDELCCSRIKSNPATMETNDSLLLQSLTSRYSSSIIESLDNLPLDLSFLITDPYIPNHPIVFASRGFLSASGFSREEIVGRNARMFQGPDTDRRSVIEIREAIRQEKEVQISLMNYRKDGTGYWMLFHLCPVFGRDDGRLVHFFAVQVPIARRERGGGVIFGGCRNELRCSLLLKGLEGEERREAGERERRKAVDGAAKVLSKLAEGSEIMGRVVCGEKRCGVEKGIYDLPSFLCSSLGRIKLSFVL